MVLPVTLAWKQSKGRSKGEGLPATGEGRTHHYQYLCTKVVLNSSYMPKNAKYGGRRKGTGNKISAELKEVLNEYCLNEFQYLNANIERLTLSERLVFFVKVLPFVLPKNAAHEENMNEAAKVPIIIFSNNK